MHQQLWPCMINAHRPIELHFHQGRPGSAPLLVSFTSGCIPGDRAGSGCADHHPQCCHKLPKALHRLHRQGWQHHPPVLAPGHPYTINVSSNTADDIVHSGPASASVKTACGAQGSLQQPHQSMAQVLQHPACCKASGFTLLYKGSRQVLTLWIAPLLEDAAARHPWASMAIMEIVSWLWGLGQDDACCGQAEVPAAGFGSRGLYGPQLLAGSGLTSRLKLGWQAPSCLHRICVCSCGVWVSCFPDKVACKWMSAG